MTAALAGIIGYLLGSAPTANLIARLRGIDLRSEGSTNPGANNARRLGGIGLALMVLIVEAGKGAAAIAIGEVVAADVGIVVAGIAAVLGNVYNIWYRFEGGKGLGISLGVLLVALPAVVPLVVLAMAIFAGLTRSTGKGTLGGLTLLVFASFMSPASWLPTPWGLDENDLIAWLLVGMSLIIAPKHLKDARGSA